MALFYGANLVKPNWKKNPHMQKFADLTGNGGKSIQGPLLVIHGEADMMNSPAAVKVAVEKTTRLLPSAQIESVWVPDVRHAPALGASSVCGWTGLQIALQALKFHQDIGHLGSRVLDQTPSTTRSRTGISSQHRNSIRH